MRIDQKQQEILSELWDRFLSSERKYTNAGAETSSIEVDEERSNVMPEIRILINQFLDNELELEEFKTQIDSINKRHPFWGFKGINGQMFFNMLTKTAIEFDKKEELAGKIKASIHCPADIDEAIDTIRQFEEYVNLLGGLRTDRRSAPKTGSIPYFLSYFWQIQSPEHWPVYYTSSVNSLIDLGIWTPVREITQDYKEYYLLCFELAEMLSGKSSQDISLWDIEHLFWFYMQLEDETIEEETIPIKPTQSKELKSIPESFIPPVVSILPKLAEHDKDLEAIAEEEGKSVVILFEERLAILFRMLGFQTKQLGQGSGRNPDGIAYCREHNYVIIFDAKVRQDGYSMGTDERAIKEYINANAEGLRRGGYRNVYFMIISSSFRGDHDEPIRNLKIETDVREVILMETTALLALLDGKLRDPEFSLGPIGLQTLLASSGVITEDYVRREFLN